MRSDDDRRVNRSGLTLVVPAAGRGNRMRVVDPSVPKELLRVAGKPAIQFAIEEGRHAGAQKIVVILNRAKQALAEFLQQLDAPIELEYQRSPAGEMDAIALAERHTDGGPVAVLYPDNLAWPGPGALRHLVSVYLRYQRDVVALTPVTSVNAWATSDSGKVDLEPITADLYRVQKLLPKGRGRFQRRAAEELRACGIAVHGPYLFDEIRLARPDTGSGEFTDRAVRVRICRDRGLLGARLPGTVFDLGDPSGYRHCQTRLGDAHNSG